MFRLAQLSLLLLEPSQVRQMLVSLKSLIYLLCLLIVVATAHWVYLRLFSLRGIPNTIAWAGVDRNSYFPWFSRACATLRSLSGTRQLLEEGYEKYTKKDLPFVIPNILTGPELIIPPSQMDWLLHQPEHVLDQNEVNRDFLQADHTMLHRKVIFDSVHGEVIHKELTRGLGEFTGAVVEEIDYAFRATWGSDTKNWKDVVTYDTMSEVITRISNRVLVGLPLCRNEHYLYSSSRFARWVILESAAISILPGYLKPIFGPLITLSDYKLYLNIAKHVFPIWRERTSAPPLDEKKKSDYVQWCLDHADDSRDPDERGIDMISKRLAALTFAAIQSSVVTSSNLLFDLAASPLTPFYLEEIRNDIQYHHRVENYTWSKSALARMATLDSTLRESMRLWGFVSRGVMKKVVAKKGVVLPNGVQIPYGTKVGIHAHPIHRDESNYPHASEFDAFRFCRPVNQDGSSDHSENIAEIGMYQGIPLVTTSSKFMAFSHGKHACPGRFFASQQLKLVLAYIAMNYDIQLINRRPENKWFVASQGPPLGHKITIRRREGTV